MRNTTPISSLESITSDLLLAVSGGCHQHRCCCPPAASVQPCIVNMPQPAPQILPQATPLAPSGNAVTTSVSINGQPATT